MTTSARGPILLVGILAIVAAFWYRQSIFSEPPAPDPMHVAFVTGGSGPFWKLTEAGAEAAAQEYDVNLDILTPEHREDTTEQFDLLMRLDRDDYQGIAVSPLDAEQQTKLINRIVESVPVVTFDSDAPLSNRAYYVGASNYGAGQQCYKLMTEALNGEGKVVVLGASRAKVNVAQRILGIEESIEQSDSDDGQTSIQLVDVLEDDGDHEKCRENLRGALEAESGLDGVIGLNGYHALVILEVLEEAGKLGEVKVVAFDTAEATLDGIEAGHIYGTVAQDPFMYGYEAVRVLTRLHAGDAAEVPIVGGGEVNVPCEAVRKDGLDNLKKRLASRRAAAGEEGAGPPSSPDDAEAA